MEKNEMTTENQSLVDKIGGIKTIVAAGAVVVLAGLTGVHFYAQGEAEAEFRKTLRLNDLDFIDYRDFSYNIFSGTITLEDILIIKEDIKVRNLISQDLEIEEIVVSSYELERDSHDVSVTVKGLKLNPRDHQGAILSELLKPIYQFHYDSINLNLVVDSVQNDDRDGEVRVSIGADDIAEIEYELVYERMNVPDAFNELANIGFLGLMRMSPSNYLPSFDFVEFKLSYIDHGFFERFKEIKAREMLRDYRDNPEDMIVLDEKVFREALENEGGMTEEMKDDFVEALSDFMESPDKFTIKLEADRPFDLLRELKKAADRGRPTRDLDSIEYSFSS